LAIFLALSCFCSAGTLDLGDNQGKDEVDFVKGNYSAEEAAKSQPSSATADEGPWMICDIAADGLKNIRKKTVTKNVSAKIGYVYKKSNIQDDVTSLMALGNFDTAEVDISPMDGQKKNKGDKNDDALYKCNKITFIVKERPIFDKVVFNGRKALSKTTLQDAMSLKVKDPYSEPKMAADMEKIKAAYLERGYTNAQASFKTEIDQKENIAKVTITVSEGKRAKVKNVVVEGLNKVPLKKFLKQLSNRKGKVYKEQNMPQDNYKVTTYVRDLGFYDFKIDDYKTSFNEDKSEVTITYTVKEGDKVKFGNTTFSGNTVYSSKDLENSIFYVKGKLFNQQKFDSSVRDIQEKYANKGYLRAEINPVKTKNEKTGELDINFDITENNIVFIDHIDISGNEATKTYVFSRELTIKEGQIFNYAQVKRSQQKIMNLGFINDAQIDISPTDDPSKVDVGYNIVEGRPGMFTAGLAVSSLDGLYGDVSINHLNLFGTAQRLSLRAMFGSKILDYTLSWSTPWLGDKPITLGVDAFNTKRYRAYKGVSSAYTELDKGGRIYLGPRFNDDIYNLNLSYGFKNVDIYDIDVDNNEKDTGLVKGRTNISTLGTSFTVDTRDNYWDATEGASNSAGLDLSGGPMMGDLDIYELSLKSSFNQTLININKDYPIVLMIGNRAGLVKPYGRTDVVPAYERIFLGGADTVRGYESTGQIGPETGGNLYYVANAELKFPLAREGRRTIAQLAAFFDIGNSWEHFDDIRLKTGPQEDEFKMGAGLGLRIVTPSLPIRLDWGYGFNHASGDKRGYIYFSMANLF